MATTLRRRAFCEARIGALARLAGKLARSPQALQITQTTFCASCSLRT
jgi:hypothetical protein